jgi:hypothetical protein
MSSPVQPPKDEAMTSDLTEEHVVIRAARPGDDVAVERLAQLEGVRSPGMDGLIVAELDGEVLAALRPADNDDGAIADPFRHTGQLVELLQMRAAHMRGELPRQRGAVRTFLSWTFGESRRRPAATVPPKPAKATQPTR